MIAWLLLFSWSFAQSWNFQGREFIVESGQSLSTRAAGVARVPMNFADAIYFDADDWKTRLRYKHLPRSVTLAFTFYPKDTAKWFRPLLASRMRALARLDSSLFQPGVQWKIFFQTEVISERHARKLFHGALIEYDDAPVSDTLLPSAVLPASYRFLPAMENVLDIINGTAAVDDSTVFKVLDRNPTWDKMVVIVDLTGSMYPYSALLIRWLNVHHAQGKIKHLVFFNDGDDILHPNRQKRIGATGGIYHAKPDSMQTILLAMDKAIRSGAGGDVPENNIEALLAAIEKFPDEKEYYMIADNYAPVRDMELLKKVKKPVHVIVCRAPHRYDSVLSDYVKIAWKTRGSVQLMEKSFSFAKANPTDKFIYVRKAKYEIDPYEGFYRR